jgi:hypothetical protein
MVWIIPIAFLQKNKAIEDEIFEVDPICSRTR